MDTPQPNDPVPPVARPLTGAGAPQVTWDDSAMRTSHANVCQVMGTREEIALLFGTNQAWQAGSTSVNVKLSDRILLNPYAAKRLWQLLGQGLKEYEAHFGELKV